MSASEEAEKLVQDLKEQLKAKDELIRRLEADSLMNARIMKISEEENHRLTLACLKLEEECVSYEETDRVNVMEQVNKDDYRALEAESRVRELEKEWIKFFEELQFYKNQVEGQLVDTLISTLISTDDVEVTSRSFLEANSEVEVCQKMLEMFESLEPSTLKVLALASKVKILQKEKDHLSNNLTPAEEEVDEEIRRSIPRDCSPIEKKRDFIESPSPRKPLSPLRHDTAES